MFLSCFFTLAILVSCIGSGPEDRYRRNNYQPVPSYARPVRQPPVYQQQPYYYGTPNSRAYYNPYDFQQPYGRNPYSDYDQYYVPPNQYYNNEDTSASSPFDNVM